MTRHVVLVCGPPCAGKSTLVTERRLEHDLVVDHDDLARRAGSPRTHAHHQTYRDRAELEAGRLLRRIAGTDEIRAWVIRSLPLEHDRLTLARQIRATHTLVVTEPRDVLLERAQHRSHARYTVGVIDRWLAAYAADQRRLQQARDASTAEKSSLARLEP